MTAASIGIDWAHAQPDAAAWIASDMSEQGGGHERN